MNFKIEDFDVAKFDSILEKGLSRGVGRRDVQVCIEAAICQTLNLPHGDDPQCVSHAVRKFKICLNDSPWSSPQSRAKGLRNLGLAQLGSKNVVDDVEFTKRLSEKLIRVLIPALFRDLFPNNGNLLAAADRCEKEGTSDAASYAADAADAAFYAASYAASYASDAAAEVAKAAKAAFYAASYAASYAAKAAKAASTRLLRRRSRLLRRLLRRQSRLRRRRSRLLRRLLRRPPRRLLRRQRRRRSRQIFEFSGEFGFGGFARNEQSWNSFVVK